MAEIIDLSDDEICEVFPAKKAKLKRFKCLNPECKTENNLLRATLAIKRFYGVQAYPKKTRVCAMCSTKAKVHSKVIIDSMRTGAILLTSELATPKNTVVLSDSDSDLTDKDEASAESEFEFDLSEFYNPSGMDAGEQLKTLIGNITDELDLKKQVTEGMKGIHARLFAAERGFQSLDTEFSKLESSLDKIRADFYDAFRQEDQYLPSIDIGEDSVMHTTEITEVIANVNNASHLPPNLPLVRPELKPNDNVYSMKYSLFARWVPAAVIAVEKRESNNTSYKIRYNSKNTGETVLRRTVIGRNLAYADVCPTRINVGIRVIAKYLDEDPKASDLSGSFYVGIVAETPSGANKYRYLIFFDDGYAQYVYHPDIRVVVESSPNSWDDVDSDSREFIKEYLETYPERPMVRLQKYNYIKTEQYGQWQRAQVMEVDCSLVKMLFKDGKENKMEWIYRGSTRLSPLYNKKMNMQSQNEGQTIRRRTFHQSNRVVEYINYEHVKDDGVSQPTEKRAVARKSTTGRPGTPPPQVQDMIIQESKGILKKMSLSNTGLYFKPHQCSNKCISDEGKEKFKSNSPIVIPLLMKWSRQVCKEKKKTVTKIIINYSAPCGRRLRSIEEVFRYLRLTKSSLEIDYFSFDYYADPCVEWEPVKCLYAVTDITNGVENIPISCVNSLDSSPPAPLMYCNYRKPTENVNLNLDPSFLVCCSCDDDCQDKTRCECWQLTVEGAGHLGISYEDEIGYNYRRLQAQVPSGIYECNAMCKCKNTCLNRVVQHPIRQKLQLFKTARRGWGVRTLHDIHKGAFICVYVGKVLNEAVANQEGRQISGGDDYYAELDFIEAVEGIKEDFESDVDMDEGIDDDDKKQDSRHENHTHFNSNKCDDKAFHRSQVNVSKLSQRDKSARILAKSKVGGESDSSRSSSPVSKLSSEKATDGKSNSRSGSPMPKDADEDDENDVRLRQKQTFAPSSMAKDTSFEDRRKKSVRKYFGDDESVYIMDAKTMGNIGRYLNHSCQPNVFVQNVFVDTHDIRFPWVSFFALTYIKAGQELTWDYNYDVGSVPGKIKYCYCMAKKCRGRLL